MDGCVAELFGNLREIHSLGPNQFFGGIDFQMGEILNDPHFTPLVEYLLELGAAD